MKLSEYLKETGISQAAFAVGLKSDQGHVSDLVTGKVRPTVATIVACEKLTNGQVGFIDWRLPVTIVVPKPLKKVWKEPVVKSKGKR